MALATVATPLGRIGEMTQEIKEILSEDRERTGNGERMASDGMLTSTDSISCAAYRIMA